MTEKRQCPKCGAELSPGAAQGLCPKCLLDAGLETHAARAPGEAATGPFVTPSQAAAATVPKPARFTAPYSEKLAQQFPQLDNIEHLGQGGMGVVYKARQRQLNRLVAVKILPPSVGDDPAFAERFTREAQALARLNHSNIVQVYDFGRTEEYFYFIMEYVDGVNLRVLIREGKLKPEEALKIVPQICEALQFAHDEGIVHRDIKPENILIDKKGRVKIADFGLAKLLGHAADDLSLTGTGQLMGTLGYMAPEQLQQAHSVDHRADIYSLGVVFYEMLTGQLPIGRFELPSKKVHVDVRLDEVVLRSLESEPDRRYQHASDVKTDLEIISAQNSPKEPPASKPALGSQSDRSAHPPWVVTTFAKWWSERDRWVASGVKTGLLIRTEAFAWTCAIAAICFGSIGFFLPIVMLRSYTPASSILLTFFIGETGALVFGILGRRVMKFAVPIALIVVGGLLILTPVVGHVYENTTIRQMLVDVQKQTVTPGFTTKPEGLVNPNVVSLAFQLAEANTYDYLCFLLGALMIVVGVVTNIRARR